LIFPMFTMVMLTLILGCITVKARFESVKNGSVNAKYYKLMQGDNIPDFVTKTTRCFNNQFEIPVIFYVACTLYISLGIESLVGIVFAWAFVVLRSVHAYIHLTYNHIIHRMSVFWAAFISVIALWVNLIIHQI
jgi:hypothetical protein